MRNINYKKVTIALVCLVAVIGVIRITYLFFESKRVVSAFTNDEHYPETDIQTDVNDRTQGGYSVSRPVLHKDKIDEQLKSYIDQAVDAYQTNWKAAGGKSASELNITYQILHFSKQTVTISFNQYEQVNGKKTLRSKIFTYDLPSQKKLSLKNLFAKDADYLTELSDIAFEELSTKKDKSLTEKRIKEITEAKAANFNSFAVLKNTLVFYLFPEAGGDSSTRESFAVKKDLFGASLLESYRSKDRNMDRVKEVQPEHIIVKLPPKNDWIDPSQKVIALTFDDGPHPKNTMSVLRSLKKQKAHATFFVLGSRVELYPGVIQKMSEQGNEIGNHSWDHPLLTRLDKKKVLEQVNKTQKAVARITGVEPTLIRPPYGASDDKVRKYIGDLDITLWDIDPEDWKSRNKKAVVKQVLEHAEDSKVILMHDIYNTSATAADEVIKKLQKEGYQLVTISELKKVKQDRRRYHIRVKA